MRNSIKAAAAGIALSLFGASQMTAAMASDATYTVVNTNGGIAIQQVWVARAGEPNSPWTLADMDSVVAPGTNVKFTMTAPGGNCFYDIKVRFSDNTVQTFGNVNVCRGDRVIAA